MADYEEDNLIIKCFTQSPNVILYGLPHLPIQDRWALLTLMGLCWDRSQTGKTLEELEGPYKLSLREISNLTGVDYTILRSKQGKNPREGVLDRLGRFGYIAICEGRPVEEYTGALGREQTYLYIHLRKIWLENMSFADVWRVPANRLTNANLVAFTVDHANSHVDVANSSVGNANNHVDHANHTVDAASTNFVLRQENIKQILGDDGKTLASNDAAPTSSSTLEELKKKAFKYIARRKEITYYDLEKYLQKFVNVRGTRSLILPHKNAIVWDGVSAEYVAIVLGLYKEDKITVKLCEASLYEKARKLNIPLATEVEDHDNPQWHPQVIYMATGKKS